MNSHGEHVGVAERLLPRLMVRQDKRHGSSRKATACSEHQQGSLRNPSKPEGGNGDKFVETGYDEASHIYPQIVPRNNEHVGGRMFTRSSLGTPN